MVASISDIKTRLALIEKEITGVVNAYPQAPAALPETDLPLFLNFAGAATHNVEIEGELYDLEQREFTARLYVILIQGGVSTEAESKTEPFIELCNQVFLSRPGLSSPVNNLGPLAYVQRMTLLSDTGIRPVQFSSGGQIVQQYLGIEFRLRVETVVPYQFADKE